MANSLGLWVAARLIGGVDYGDNLWAVLIAAVLFSLVNMFIKPVVVVLSLPAIIFSLGIFMLFINALMLYLVTALYPSFVVGSLSAAILTVIVVWIVNYALSVVVDKD